MTISESESKELLEQAFQRLARLEAGWEKRPEQRRMAHLWGETLERGGIVAIEAPTGIGKSLAYLLPALIRRIRGSGPIVVSTHTKALQEQLLTQDVPLALRALGRPLRVVTLKGRANYLCRRRAQARLAQRRLFAGAGLAEDALLRLTDWVDRTETGELDELAKLGIALPQHLLLEIASDAIVCAGSACDAPGGCFAKRARRDALRADVVLVNHALLFSDPGLRASLVAEAGALVLDEAHQIERVAREQLGISLGLNDWTRLAARTDARAGALRLLSRSLRRGRAGVFAEAMARAERALPPVLEHARAFAIDLERLLPVGVSASRLPRDLDLAQLSPSALDQLLAALGETARGLEALLALADGEGASAITPGREDAVEEVRARWAAWLELERALRSVTGLEERGAAFYVDRDDRGSPRLNRRPVRVGDAVRDLLLSLCDRVLFTSATIQVGNEFAPALRAWGLKPDEARAEALPSPFPLERQVFCAVMDGLEPSDPDFPARLADLVVSLATSLRRNTLVLLTSYQMLDSVAARCAGPLSAARLRLLCQSPGEPASALAEKFRAGEGTVLLGTASFWEGVDFPGAALEVLVIARLPFGVPTDPVLLARSELITAEGGDPFRDLQLPEAILRFRQGLGRLIRTARDRGAAIVVDPRIIRSGYGRQFQSTLPCAPRVARTVAEVVEETRAWFAREEEACTA